jgi:uncharacterized protein (TIGR02217 family)
MSFDEILIPLRIGFGSQGGPSFSTEIVTVDGGYERRNQNWSQARRRFDAATGLRRAADVATLIAFFHARAGRARGFRLRDWSDFTSASDGTGTATFADQIIGSGTGSQTQFQLIKTYTSGAVSHVRTIKKPVSGSVSVGLDGAPQASGWSVDTATGLITFAAAPSSSVVVTAGFTFDVPVRFDSDQLNLSAEDFQQMRVQIPIVEVRI